MTADDTLTWLEHERFPASVVWLTIELDLCLIVRLKRDVLNLRKVTGGVVADVDTLDILLRWNLQAALKLLALIHRANLTTRAIYRILFEEKLNRADAVVDAASDAGETAIVPV